jgi:hypothetical protein
MHSVIHPSSYGGFKPWSDITPPAMKPGESLESRANKFQNAGYGAVYRDAPPRELPRDATNTAVSFNHNVAPEDYRVPDRRGLSVTWVRDSTDLRNKKMIGTTDYLAGFQDPQGAGSYRIAEPEWLVESKKVIAEPLARPPQLSSYQAAHGVDVYRDAPAAKAYMYKSGMASTTLDLAAGTTSVGFRPPGYGGHIPADARNPVAAEQGLGVDARAANGTLRMNFRHNMKGYSGFAPRNARNDAGEMTCGANPATTSGAAALNFML